MTQQQRQSRERGAATRRLQQNAVRRYNEEREREDQALNVLPEDWRERNAASYTDGYYEEEE